MLRLSPSLRSIPWWRAVLSCLVLQWQTTNNNNKTQPHHARCNKDQNHCYISRHRGRWLGFVISHWLHTAVTNYEDHDDDDANLLESPTDLINTLLLLPDVCVITAARTVQCQSTQRSLSHVISYAMRRWIIQGHSQTKKLLLLLLLLLTLGLYGTSQSCAIKSK